LTYNSVEMYHRTIYHGDIPYDDKKLGLIELSSKIDFQCGRSVVSMQ